MTGLPESLGGLLEVECGELRVAGHAISEIADAFGTPLFVYDPAILDAKLDRLRAALPEGFDVYYSIKANPLQAIQRHLVGRGCGLELASAGELYQALAAGCAPERLLFAGPGKTDAELESAVAARVGEIHAESFDEIDRLAAIAVRAGRRTDVAVRINPAEEARGGAVQMGGKPSPFGIDEERLEEAVSRVAQHDALRFSGVHLFTGTQILDPETLVRQYRKGLEIAEKAAAVAGGPLHTVDFGGGLGIPYFPNETALDLEALASALEPLFAATRGAPAFEGTRFVLEPGRFLVGDAGVYVTRITTVKESRGQTFLVTDGGMNHHLAASGNLGQVVKRNFPGRLLEKLGQDPADPVTVVGPLCTPLDTLARNAKLPPAAPGDLFGLFQAGAYARAASPLGFLSHVSPPEVWVDAAGPRLVRRRGELADALRDQELP